MNIYPPPPTRGDSRVTLSPPTPPPLPIPSLTTVVAARRRQWPDSPLLPPPSPLSLPFPYSQSLYPISTSRSVKAAAADPVGAVACPLWPGWCSCDVATTVERLRLRRLSIVHVVAMTLATRLPAVRVQVAAARLLLWRPGCRPCAPTSTTAAAASPSPSLTVGLHSAARGCP
jgi:hypothetical protein